MWNTSAPEVKFILKLYDGQSLLVTLLKNKVLFTSLSILVGKKKKKKENINLNERRSKEKPKKNTILRASSAFRLQSNKIIHVLKFENFIAPTSPTWL